MDKAGKLLKIYQLKIAASEKGGREAVEGYDYDYDELNKLKDILESTTRSLESLHDAYSLFSSISAPTISPDGKLGGSGYIQTISEMKKLYIECINQLSDISDTLADELNNPLWINQIPQDEQTDIEEIIEEKERVEGKVDEDDMIIESEVRAEEDEAITAILYSEDDESVEPVVSFDVPTRGMRISSSNSLDKKLDKIYYFKTGSHLDPSKLMLIKHLYLRDADLSNLSRVQPLEARRGEFSKMAWAINCYLKSKNLK